MINFSLLSEKEGAILRATVLKTLQALCVYTLEYGGELSICAFIQLKFENGDSLAVATGKFADNIILLDKSDFENEKKKYSIQDSVKMKVDVLTNSEDLVGEKLLNVEYVKKPNEEYYWKVNFIFPKNTLCIDALIDELGFSIVR